MEKTRKLTASWFKQRLNARAILLLMVVFLVQQFSFASLHHILSDNTPEFLHYAEKHPAQPGSSKISLDIDVEVVEEDEVDHSDEHADFSATTLYTTGAILYIHTVNTHYLNLAEPTHRQADRPLFLLHHCWKAHLA